MTSTTVDASCSAMFEQICLHVNMAGRIDTPAKCKLPSFIRFLQAEVVFIHDNANPHSAVVTQQLLEQFKCDVSVLPAYSPDLATGDFHLFPKLKNLLRGQSFQENEDIQSDVKAYLMSLAATFFEEGIGNLVHRHDKCLNLLGDYVKK
ncbi:hypothetical protein AVEN_259375-1 [Araneus ventricosus]|uniref:Histone-lysine N-methyltransferase SETMAR n=1 Tax=Araneus ventricosus TaxID=182803 RepID=A0A4Y2DV36_ARAVE|nr:hypothetical protein AVEN_259375-1 [Araneus ventricosus]